MARKPRPYLSEVTGKEWALVAPYLKLMRKLRPSASTACRHPKRAAERWTQQIVVRLPQAKRGFVLPSRRCVVGWNFT